MILKAVVIDNSEIFTKGVITVRIAGYFFRQIIWDLAENYPDAIKEGQDDNGNFTYDFQAQLTGEAGGGRGYGVVFLPKINQKGLIEFLGGNNKRPVWIKSLYEIDRDDSYNVNYVNLPSDNTELDGPNSDAVLSGGAPNLDTATPSEQKHFIARFKSTLPGTTSSDDVDWEQRPTTYIISAGDEDFRLRHLFPEDGWDSNKPSKYQEITINKTNSKETITNTIQNVKDKKSSTVIQQEDNIEYSVTDKNGDVNSVSVQAAADNNGIEINSKGGNALITVSPDGKIVISSSNDKIYLKPEVQVADGGDHLVKYSELKSYQDKWEHHGHICPSGPTVGDPTDGSPAPLPPQTINYKQNMEAQKITSD